MTKVVVARIGSPARKSRKGAVGKKLVRGPGGRRTAVYAVDSTSKTFDRDLITVFESNVAAAREANTRIFGSPDGPGKS